LDGVDPQAWLRVRFFFSYTSPMGTMPRREASEEQARINVKFASTMVIAAAIVVAVRWQEKTSRSLRRVW
jgi:hypothetical protein